MINTCNYLFGKSASEIFPTNQFNEKLIEDSLQTLVKVSDLLAEKPEALFLFCPTAFNNQCHLYSMMLVQKVPDKRFYHLSFLLSFGFLTDAKLLEKVVRKHFTEALPEPQKKYSTFLKDPGGCMRRAARTALNELFEKHLKTTFSLKEDEPLYKELSHLAKQDLHLADSNGKGSYYTLPKLAGVLYLVDTVAKEKLSLLFRVRVITEKGSGSFAYSPQKEVAPKTPAIVFELMVSDFLTMEQCDQLAKKCPTHSMRAQSSKQRHAENKTCLFCSPDRIDATPFKEKFLPILEKHTQMLYAFGTDFMMKHQQHFLPHFENETQLPLLSKFYRDSIPDIEKFSLSRTDKGCLSVLEVSFDLFDATTTTFLMDKTYETHLKERELL